MYPFRPDMEQLESPVKVLMVHTVTSAAAIFGLHHNACHSRGAAADITAGVVHGR